jgi:hypothetical protein
VAVAAWINEIVLSQPANITQQSKQHHIPTQPPELPREQSVTMGLIKAGIYAGAAIYAVNKISQASENRRNREAGMPPQEQHQQRGFDDQSQYMASGAAQDYYNHTKQPQTQERFVPMEFTDRRSPAQQNQPMYLNNNINQPEPVYAYNAEGDYYYEVPPPQYQSGTQQRGFVESEEVASEKSGSKSKSLTTGKGPKAILHDFQKQAQKELKQIEKDFKKSGGGKDNFLSRLKA